MGLKDNLIKIQEEEKEFDNQGEIKGWIQAVDDFYTQIEVWFKDLIDENLMKLETTERLTNEELLGDYTIKDLEISLANRIVKLEPLGAMLIGAWGRIDMYMSGFKHDIKPLLRMRNENDHNKFTWVIRKNSKSLKFEYEPITKEIIEKIFEEWTQ